MLRSEIDKAETLGQFTISPVDPGESTIKLWCSISYVFAGAYNSAEFYFI